MALKQVFVNLLYYPEWVAKIARSIQDKPPSHLLKDRSLETPDWNLEELWQMAVFYHLNSQLELSLRYYHRILEWSEHDKQQHGHALAATGHVFLSSAKYTDACQLFELALKDNPKLVRTPYFLAEAYTELGKINKALGMLQFFCSNYPYTDDLLARAFNFYHGILERGNANQDAQNLLQEASKRLDSWSFELAAQSYLPLLPIMPETEGPGTLKALTHQRFDNSAWGEWFPYRLFLRADTDQTRFISYQQMLTQQISKYFPDGPEPESAGKRRIALVGELKRLDNHAFLDLITETSRKYSVTVICIGDIPEELAEEDWMRIYQVTKSLQDVYNAILSHKPDLLIYLNIGPQSPRSMALATQRLAPRQAVLAAYPMSTQLPEIDYFISFDWLEPVNAQAHYSEKLIQLSGTPQRNVSLPDRFVDSEKFAQSQNKRTYFCPVRAPNLHVDFYPVLAEILRLDPEAQILIMGYSTWVDEACQAYFKAQFPESADRILFLPTINERDFLSFVRVVDLVLDPIHQGISTGLWRLILLGTPVVSWRGEYARGRYAAGIYQRLGLTESVVEERSEYAARAVALAQDPESKARFREHIQAHRKQLFDLPACLESFHTFLDQTLDQIPAINKAEASPEESSE